MKSNFILILILFLAAFFSQGSFGQQQWPMAGGCRERTSWAENEDELYPPFNHIVSYLPGYNMSFFSITILDNIMCTGVSGTPNRFFGIDMTSGDTIWSAAVPGSKSSVSFWPAMNDTLAFVGGHQGTGLLCLDRFTGEKKWFRPTGNLYTRNAILDEDRLYFMIDSLFCLDVGSGDTLWARPLEGQTTPAVDESNCYVTGSHATRSFNKLTGEKIWEKYNSNYYLGFNILDETCLYTCSADSVLARKKTDGQLVWGHRIQDVHFTELSSGNMAVDDHVVAVSIWSDADTLGQIYVLDKVTGEYKWHYTFGDEGATTPTIANGVIYIVSWNERKLYAFEAETGEILFEDNSFDYKAEQPVVHNHRLYVIATQAIIALGNDIPSPVPGKKQESGLKVYPNPGTGIIHIEYLVDEVSEVSMAIIDMTGKKAALVSGEIAPPGSHVRNFDLSRLSPGVYFCELRIARTGHSDQVTSHRVKLILTQ